MLLLGLRKNGGHLVVESVSVKALETDKKGEANEQPNPLRINNFLSWGRQTSPDFHPPDKLAQKLRWRINFSNFYKFFILFCFFSANTMEKLMMNQGNLLYKLFQSAFYSTLCYICIRQS